MVNNEPLDIRNQLFLGFPIVNHERLKMFKQIYSLPKSDKIEEKKEEYSEKESDSES
jgi:hypothetical protein